MNVLSLFTGVGGFDLGLERAGHTIVGQVEWDKKCQAILRKHWPDVPLHEDVCGLDGDWCERHGVSPGRWSDQDRTDGRNANAAGGKRNLSNGPVDLVCGGFPCQDLSVAGKRAGLAGERSGLFFEAARISDLVLGDGGWVLIENVPGLLSSNGGRDFGVVLATLADLGFHDLAWRVLDSRYFGVPQRRRRVFILGRRASGRRAAEVLLEPESGGGNHQASRQSGQATPPRSDDGVAKCLTTSQERLDSETQDFIVSPPPDTNGVREASGLSRRVDDPVYGWSDEMMDRPRQNEIGTIRIGTTVGAPTPSIIFGRGKVEGPTCPYDPKPDSPRYAQMGNAVTVPVAEWIGHRLRRFA